MTTSVGASPDSIAGPPPQFLDQVLLQRNAEEIFFSGSIMMPNMSNVHADSNFLLQHVSPGKGSQVRVSRRCSERASCYAERPG